MSSKRRKKISEEHMAPEFTLRTSSTKSNLCKQAPESRPTNAVSFGTWKDGTNVLLANPEISGSCNGLDLCNIMKLFDLDNEEDERSFCAAMERPLSPICPVLELLSHNTTDVYGSKDSLGKIFHVGRSTIQNDAAKCRSFDVIEVEIDSNNKSKSCVGNSTRQIEKPDGFIFPISSMDGFEMADSQQITDLRSCINSESSPQMSDIVTIGRESPGLCKTDVSLTCSSLPRYLIVHPDIKDAVSISRICGAIRRYMSNCTMISSPNYIKESLIILSSDEGLSSMEKACTFVTVMLQKINKDVMNLGTSMGSDICQFIDTFSCNHNAVLSDIKMNMMDLWDLSDLLNVIEDFLNNRRALLFGDASSDMIKSASLDESGGILCGQEAPNSLVVAGGALLATICASIDDIGFVCEVSCNILRTQKSNSSLVLIILHVFAHICGPKYFGEQYGLVVNVIRSLVVYLERLNSSDTIASCFPFLVGEPYKPWPCCNCPFVHDPSSTDEVVSLLLKELQSYIIKSTGILDKLDPINQVKSGAKMYEVDCLSYVPVMVCENFDLFSLLEIVACYMSWNWSFENIVCPVLEMLESCAMECFTAVVITFLGQLGRIGIEAHGYDDEKVENLRNRFSSFLTRSAMGNSELLVQLASATALSGLTPISFEELVDSDSTIPETAVSLKNWFFSLSNEQRSSCKLELFSCP
ncbi:hypothetical protein Leryth_025890 [Lithospermum erythrorhizon]|nr:hypothetical protein Leryth_025890 [Lithospermum erythrorhizon]